MSVDEKNTLWTVSNGLSIARVLLVIPMTYFLVLDGITSRFIALGLLALGALTDFLDGYVARKFSQVTDFGKILDPLADKVAIALLTIILALQHLLPLWFVTVVLLRDLLIFAGGIYIKNKKEIVVQSNMLGKWTAGVLAILVAIAMFELETLKTPKIVLLIVATTMILLSFVSYTKRFVQIMKE